MQEIAVNSLYRVSWADPAGNPNQATHGTSRSAIVTVGQDNLERVFILEAWVERVATTILEQRILATQNRWQPLKFGIDVSGPQGMFYDTMRRRAREEGVNIRWHPEALLSNKMFAIESAIEPVARGGRLFRPDEKYCRALKDEWHRFPDKHFNDGMDALSNAIRLLPASLPEHMRLMSRQQLASYLRKTGMSAEMIEQRLEQHDHLTQSVGV
jgi:hypothetical protein